MLHEVVTPGAARMAQTAAAVSQWDVGGSADENNPPSGQTEPDEAAQNIAEPSPKL